MNENPLADVEQKKISIVIADDHDVIRDGLVSILAKWPEIVVVGEARNGIDAIQRWEACRPDIILLDLKMPKMDGIGVLKQIRKKDPLAKVIILTTFAGDDDVYQSVRAGAKAYLLKDAPRTEILNCIRAVQRGETVYSSVVAGKLVNHIKGEDTLTERELEVLRTLSTGLSNKEIGTKLFISEITVKVHLKNIFAKLKVTSRTEAIALSTRRGIIHMDSPEDVK